MPVWGYFVVGFVIVALVLLTFRRNTTVSHSAAEGYGADYQRVMSEADPAIAALVEAVRDDQERPIATAASRARSVVHTNILNLDRLEIPEALPAPAWERLSDLRVRLRQAMECYEWAARIAETTDLIENKGLRRAFDSLVASGDQLCNQARFDLVGIAPAQEPELAPTLPRK